jgi:hypothetical protein
MADPFLNPFWRDVWAVVGGAGVLATLIGLWLTWRQLRKTQTAASAAADAALQSRQAYDRLLLALAHRATSEAKLTVVQRNWVAASLKATDLADLLSQLSEQDEELLGLSAAMREAGHVFARIEQGTISFHGLRKKWPNDLAAVEARLTRDLRTPNSPLSPKP